MQGSGWRDGSAVKTNNCSSRGPEFESQCPHGASQPSITPVSGTLTQGLFQGLLISSGTRHVYMHAGNISMHIKK